MSDSTVVHSNSNNNEFTPPAESRYMDQIVEHMEKLYPNREMKVFHEIVSEIIHLDINVFLPTKEQPYYVLFTTGMSDLDMFVPENILQQYPNLNKAELVTFLPADWEINTDDFSVVDNSKSNPYWPLEEMKFHARLPFMYQTWLGYGHTIPNTEKYKPYQKKTKLSCSVLLSLNTIPEVKIDDNIDVNFYYLYFITKKEAQHKLKFGVDSLLKKLFSDNKNGFVLNTKRKSVV